MCVSIPTSLMGRSGPSILCGKAMGKAASGASRAWRGVCCCQRHRAMPSPRHGRYGRYVEGALQVIMTKAPGTWPRFARGERK